MYCLAMALQGTWISIKEIIPYKYSRSSWYSCLNDSQLTCHILHIQVANYVSNLPNSQFWHVDVEQERLEQTKGLEEHISDIVVWSITV